MVVFVLTNNIFTFLFSFFKCKKNLYFLIYFKCFLHLINLKIFERKTIFRLLFFILFYKDEIKIFDGALKTFFFRKKRENKLIFLN